MIPLNVFERIKITFICQSFTLRREVTDLPVWHHCCTSNSFFNIRSKRLGEISTGYICLWSALSQKNTFFFFVPPFPLYFCEGHRIKIINVAGGNAEGVKRQTTAERHRCLEGWLDELKGREGGQTLSRYTVAHWSYLCFFASISWFQARECNASNCVHRKHLKLCIKEPCTVSGARTMPTRQCLLYCEHHVKHLSALQTLLSFFLALNISHWTFWLNVLIILHRTLLFFCQ